MRSRGGTAGLASAVGAWSCSGWTPWSSICSATCTLGAALRTWPPSAVRRGGTARARGWWPDPRRGLPARRSQRDVALESSADSGSRRRRHGLEPGSASAAGLLTVDATELTLAQPGAAVGRSARRRAAGGPGRVDELYAATAPGRRRLAADGLARRRRSGRADERRAPARRSSQPGPGAAGERGLCALPPGPLLPTGFCPSPLGWRYRNSCPGGRTRRGPARRRKADRSWNEGSLA